MAPDKGHADRSGIDGVPCRKLRNHGAGIEPGSRNGLPWHSAGPGHGSLMARWVEDGIQTALHPVYTATVCAGGRRGRRTWASVAHGPKSITVACSEAPVVTRLRQGEKERRPRGGWDPIAAVLNCFPHMDMETGWWYMKSYCTRRRAYTSASNKTRRPAPAGLKCISYVVAIGPYGWWSSASECAENAWATFSNPGVWTGCTCTGSHKRRWI